MEIVADDSSLTPFAGTLVVGEFCRRTGLVGRLDGEIAAAEGTPVKVRRRGVSPGGLLVGLAESMLVGADSMLDLDRVRADRAAQPFRATEVPAVSTATQLAHRFGEAHLHGAERAFAAVANAVDVQRGTATAGEVVTLDMDSTQVEVYGPAKEGASRNYQGQLAYQPLLVTWAERDRIVAGDLLSGADATRDLRPIDLLDRALSLLPDGHGAVRARFDSGFYTYALMKACQEREVKFSISARRYPAMWARLDRIPAAAWEPALGMADTWVAETAFDTREWDGAPLRLLVRKSAFAADRVGADGRARRRRTIPKDQLALADSGQLDTVHAYSFIVTDLPGPAVEVEQFHRHRADIEERIKDAKLGVTLRRLPFGDLAANRVWQHCCALALNLASLLGEMVWGRHPDGRRIRRRAKAFRHAILLVVAKVVRHARQTRLRLPAGLPSADGFAAAYTACRQLTARTAAC